MGNKASTTRPPISTSLHNQTRAQCSAPAFQHCIDAELAAAVKANLPKEIAPIWPRNTLPIVYSPEYNISFYGIESLHPFDSKKYAHIVNTLEAEGIFHRDQLTLAQEISLDALKDVHSTEYLTKLENSPLKVAYVTQLPPLAFLPGVLLRRKVLRPMRRMAGGTVLAGALALERGWALNLGGGMHHAW